VSCSPRRHIFKFEFQFAAGRWLLGNALRPPLGLLLLLVVIVAFVIFFADAGEVAFLLVLVVLATALREQNLGVHKLVEVGGLLDIRDATLDMLLFEIEYLILRNLATKINCSVLWAEQGVVILCVTEAVDFNVYLVVRGPKVRVLALLGVAIQSRVAYGLQSFCLIAWEIVALCGVCRLLLYLRAAKVIEIFFVSGILLGHLQVRR
jgi:hypothetical protein